VFFITFLQGFLLRVLNVGHRLVLAKEFNSAPVHPHPHPTGRPLDSRADVRRQIKYMRTLFFYFESKEASVLEHIAPIYFSVYSVVIVLHACVNECALMIRLTRLDLSFLKN
jgi:hypothetical protein